MAHIVIMGAGIGGMPAAYELRSLLAAEQPREKIGFARCTNLCGHQPGEKAGRLAQIDAPYRRRIEPGLALERRLELAQRRILAHAADEPARDLVAALVVEVAR